MTGATRTIGFCLVLLACVSLAGAQGWKSEDVGNTIVGTTGISGGEFTIEGDGDDIWGAADGFRFVYLKGDGNCEIMARVTSQEQTDGWAKAGVMIRQGLAAGDTHAFMCRTPSNGVAFQNRLVTNGPSYNSNGGNGTLPRWVRLRRVGTAFVGQYAPDVGGQPGAWLQQGSNANITMTDPVYVGLAVTSHSYGNLSTAVFDNVATTGTRKMGAGIIISDRGRSVPAPLPPWRLAALPLLRPGWHRVADADRPRVAAAARGWAVWTGAPRHITQR